MVYVLAIYQASKRLLRASGMPFSFAPIYSCHATKVPDIIATSQPKHNSHKAIRKYYGKTIRKVKKRIICPGGEQFAETGLF